MTFSILGSGSVGQTIANALLKNGHEVILGSRSAENPKAQAWLATQNDRASIGTFSDAAARSEVIFLCLNGDKAIDALLLAGPDHFIGKTVVDLTNPLDFSKGFPPSLLGAYKDRSLAEAIQDTLPGAHVVKALNTLTAKLMVDPAAVNGGDHDLFVCGNVLAAKGQVNDLLATEFGWRKDNIHDLGDLSAARASEAYVTFWARLMQSQGTPMFNVKVVR